MKGPLGVKYAVRHEHMLCPGDAVAGRQRRRRWTLRQRLVEALIAALDTDGDDDVDDDDTECEVVLAGYSWGGINAVEVAGEFLGDPRVAPARRRVRDLIVVDAFQIGAGDNYTVPSGVSRLWSYRHSIEPANGCTQGLPFGPYLGRTPLCPASATCLDYDYSLAPDEEFGLSGVTEMYTGAEIDNCNVMSAALGASSGTSRGRAAPTTCRSPSRCELPEGRARGEHARIVCRGGKFIVVDLKSTNATMLNGQAVRAPTVLQEGDEIVVGDRVLRVEPDD